MFAGRDSQRQLRAFLVDDDGDLWNVSSRWNSLGNTGGGFDDRPTFTLSADGRVELYVRGRNHHLYHRRQPVASNVSRLEGVWSSGWADDGAMGGGFVDHPCSAQGPDGRLELFMTGLDGHIWHKWPSLGQRYQWFRRSRRTVASNGWSP